MLTGTEGDFRRVDAELMQDFRGHTRDSLGLCKPMQNTYESHMKTMCEAVPGLWWGNAGQFWARLRADSEQTEYMSQLTHNNVNSDTAL
jgi:hypothetical protein